MQVDQSTVIPGLKVIRPEVFHDFRGEFVLTYDDERYAFEDEEGRPIAFVEDDVSVSRRHTLRGLHGDERTWKLIQCLSGAFYYVVVDMRPGSAAHRRWEAFTLNDKSRLQVLVPAGCANGFVVLSDECVCSYKQSERYAGMQGQFTVRWDDPALGIFWPVRQPILSSRDATAELLEP